MIYFAQPTNGGAIRIGCSENVRRRTSQLGSWIVGGVEIVASIPNGSFFTEAVLLRLFDPIRVEKDWFRSCPVMWRFMLQLLPDGTAPAWVPLAIDHTDMEAELIKEFGTLDAATEIIGYSNVNTIRQTCRFWNHSSFSLAARLWVYRNLRNGVIPDELAAMHSIERAVAA